jgi:hypothetical protein
MSARPIPSGSRRAISPWRQGRGNPFSTGQANFVHFSRTDVGEEEGGHPSHEAVREHGAGHRIDVPWPHAEGLSPPRDFFENVASFSLNDQREIMAESAQSLTFA